MLNATLHANSAPPPSRKGDMSDGADFITLRSSAERAIQRAFDDTRITRQMVAAGEHATASADVLKDEIADVAQGLVTLESFLEQLTAVESALPEEQMAEAAILREALNNARQFLQFLYDALADAGANDKSSAHVAEMKQFTLDNTEGFSEDDLAVLNEALDILLQDLDAAGQWTTESEKNLSDAINNAWVTGMSVEDLVDRVSRRFNQYDDETDEKSSRGPGGQKVFDFLAYVPTYGVLWAAEKLAHIYANLFNASAVLTDDEIQQMYNQVADALDHVTTELSEAENAGRHLDRPRLMAIQGMLEAQMDLLEERRF